MRPIHFLQRLFFSILILPCQAQTEKQIQIEFQPVFGSSFISTESHFYKLDSGDSVQFETLKFYVTAIQLLNGEMQVWNEPVSNHLVDADEPKSMKISLNPNKTLVYNQIRFLFGIDSLTNVSGAKGGDLDPTKGMYWTWDNGYINAKIEGRSNRCPTRNHEFQLHIGGYRKEIQTARSVTLKVDDLNKIRIHLDLRPVLNGFDLTKTHHIMSAGTDGVAISDLLAHSFKTE